METSNPNYKPVITIAVASLLVCGLFFPLLVTGLAQAFFPYQANGELAKLNGQTVGSVLIAEQFNSSMFFHERPANDSASGVDPDITVQDALSQVPRIQTATRLSSAYLTSLVNSNAQGTLWIYGTSPYVDVLQLNILLVQQNPSVYAGFYPIRPLNGTG